MVWRSELQIPDACALGRVFWGTGAVVGAVRLVSLVGGDRRLFPPDHLCPGVCGCAAVKKASLDTAGLRRAGRSSDATVGNRCVRLVDVVRGARFLRSHRAVDPCGICAVPGGATPERFNTASTRPG